VAEWQTRRIQNPLGFNARAGSSPAPGTIRKFLKYSLAILGLIFALYPIFKNGLPDIKFSPSSFLLSVLIMLLAYTLLPVIWFFVAQIFGIFISFSDAVFSWYISSIGRYIPGKVWQFVGRAAILNHPSGSVFSATLYEHLILMAGAGLFSLIFPKFLYIQLGIIFVLLLVLFTWKFSIKTLIPLILSVVYWSLAGLSAYFTSRALNLKFGYPEISFVYSFSFVASYVLPLTPAGLGIREGIISLLMGYDPTSSSFAILTRLIILIVDIIMLAFGFLYKRFAR
jgi:hypothetical protein